MIENEETLIPYVKYRIIGVFLLKRINFEGGKTLWKNMQEKSWQRHYELYPQLLARLQISLLEKMN